MHAHRRDITNFNQITMIYKILSITDKMTSTGKPMKNLELEDTNRGVFKVNIFSDFPHYAELAVNSTIDGEIRKNDKGYDNLYSNEIKPRGGASGAFKTAQMEKVMDKKAENIEKAQENRSEGVKISATMRDAVQLAIVANNDPTRLNTLEEEIIYWRKWLWTHWDDPTTEAIYPQ